MHWCMTSLLHQQVRFEGLETVDRWRLAVRLRCLTRFLRSSSEGSICEAADGASLLASLTLLHPQLLKRGALVVILFSLPAQPYSHSSPILPMLLWLTAHTPGSRVWKSNTVKASVKSTSNPHDPWPCSANIWRTAHTSDSMSLSTHEKIESKRFALLHRKTLCFC